MAQANPIIFQTTDWNAVPVTTHAGETGSALWKTISYGSLRIRVVEYSPNYKADHWCKAGHILYCLEGEMTTELSDGRVIKLLKGMSYQVSDDMSSHRSYSEHGARLLIVDGGFLKTNQKHQNPWRM
jgi:hypothetical protein